MLVKRISEQTLRPAILKCSLGKMSGLLSQPNAREMWRSLNMVECLYRASSPLSPVVILIPASTRIAKCSDGLHVHNSEFLWFSCAPLDHNDDHEDDLDKCLMPYEGLCEGARRVDYDSISEFRLLDMSSVQTIEFLKNQGVSDSLNKTFRVIEGSVTRHSQLELDKQLALAMLTSNIFASTNTVGWYHPSMKTFDGDGVKQRVHRREIMLLSNQVDVLLTESRRIPCAPAAPEKKTKKVSYTPADQTIKKPKFLF